MYESSGSQFFRTITGIQPGPDAFDESRFVMTFLTISGVIETCSFWEVMDSFVLIAYASLAASRTLLQRLLACLNFTLYSVGTNEKSDFYELWQQHKLLKTMEMSEI